MPSRGPARKTLRRQPLPLRRHSPAFLPLAIAAMLAACLGFASRVIAAEPAPASPQAAPADAARPNIILFLIDDLGAHDLGVTGSTFYRTPNIDKLAGSGMLFTQAYAACTVCSPTRAALMTGKYPARLGITDWIPGHAKPMAKLKPPAIPNQLALEETTLAEILKKRGYATAHIGKWHLGGEGFEPTKQGFDINLGGYHRGQPPSYFDPYKIPTLPDRKPGEYLTDREADEAVNFIQASKDRPFFLNIWHYTVHTPLQAKKEMIEEHRARRDPAALQAHAVYGAMVQSMDESVGKVVAKVRELGLADKTLILFTSDNGGLTQGRTTSNVPLREGKGSPYEGGHRVPLIISMPGRVKAGARSETPVVTMDLFSTVSAFAGAPERAIDGMDLSPLLQGQAAPDRKAIHWHYPHYHPGGATPYSAIRSGDLKLIEFMEDGRLELYDLKGDPSETRNLAADRAEDAHRLRQMLHQWRRDINAAMPTPNPGNPGTPANPGTPKNPKNNANPASP